MTWPELVGLAVSAFMFGAIIEAQFAPLLRRRQRRAELRRVGGVIITAPRFDRPTDPSPRPRAS